MPFCRLRSYPNLMFQCHDTTTWTWASQPHFTLQQLRIFVFSTWCKLISNTANAWVWTLGALVCVEQSNDNTRTNTLSTWLHLHNPITISLCYRRRNSAQLPWLCFFPVKGCWKYCSLMRGCELWCALTAWPIRLTASLRLDFRPVEGELSTTPESHFLSCWELESCHDDRPQQRADSG